MKRPLVIHPFLFGLFPILFLFAHNIGEVSSSEILLPTAIVLGFTLLLLLLSRLILKDNQKAGIVVSIFLVLVFSYGHVGDAIGLGRIKERYLLLSWAILFVCGAYFIMKTRRDLHNPTKVLNIVATFLLVISLINIVPYKLKTWLISRDIKSTDNIPADRVDSRKTDTLPDIYYIILDQYGSTGTLKQVYDFDNSEFINYLSNKGFYVASESRSNYATTGQSLAASLNMEYINYLSDKVGKESKARTPLYWMLQDYKVWHFLKPKGYTFIHLGSFWHPTSRNKYADININLPLSLGFSLLLYRTTMFLPIDRTFGITPLGSTHLRQQQRIPYKLDKLVEISDMKGPVFVFAHFLLPHRPFIFDSNGNFQSEKEAQRRSDAVNYVDQLIATNNMIKALIDTLLSKSERPPIIILQADEGPLPQRYWDDMRHFNWKQATEAELREKMGILNAYYLPNVDKSTLYPSISPVNSFRLIFNLYFNTDLELLPDESYVFTDRIHLYDLFNVTDRVQGH